MNRRGDDMKREKVYAVIDILEAIYQRVVQLASPEEAGYYYATAFRVVPENNPVRKRDI